ncbi:MAG TPA: hypothetical protein PLD49_09485, partial [Thermoclostridium caenicola]|nr:hypothetical protein [Thermoclostridium caenicola]
QEKYQAGLREKGQATVPFFERLPGSRQPVASYAWPGLRLSTSGDLGRRTEKLARIPGKIEDDRHISKLARLPKITS